METRRAYVRFLSYSLLIKHMKMYMKSESPFPKEEAKRPLGYVRAVYAFTPSDPSQLPVRSCSHWY